MAGGRVGAPGFTPASGFGSEAFTHLALITAAMSEIHAENTPAAASGSDSYMPLDCLNARTSVSATAE